MKLLITRPLSDAMELADQLVRIGVEPVIFPLLDIQNTEFSLENTTQYQAILVTSANAIRAVINSSVFDALKTIPLYGVGDTSRDMAKSSGFTKTFSADGDLMALQKLVIDKLSPGGGPLLYLSGEVISGDLKALLQGEGFKVDRVTLYRAEERAAFSSDIQAALKGGEIDAIVLYSKRTAQIFAGLFLQAGLVLPKNCTVFCLSQAVADKFSEGLAGVPADHGFNIRISARSTKAHMFELIRENV